MCTTFTSRYLKLPKLEVVILCTQEVKNISSQAFDNLLLSAFAITYLQMCGDEPVPLMNVKGPLTRWIVMLKGCGMGPCLVLVSPCFRENVVATCKIGSFLCSLDNLLQKNVIVLIFGNPISKWRSFEKRAIFDLLFTFFSHQGKSYKNSFCTYLTQIHTRILLTLLTFFALPILEKMRIYQVRFLFGMSPGVDSYSCHFGTINK